MHFSTLIAALMLPLAVLAAPIARAEVDAVNQAINLFRSGVESTLAALDKVHDTASSIVSGQEAALASQANSARQFVTSAKTSVDFGFSPETEPHTPDETKLRSAEGIFTAQCMINQLEGLLVVPDFAVDGSPFGAVFQKMRNDISAARDGIKVAIQGLEELASLDDQSIETVFTLHGETPPPYC